MDVMRNYDLTRLNFDWIIEEYTNDEHFRWFPDSDPGGLAIRFVVGSRPSKPGAFLSITSHHSKLLKQKTPAPVIFPGS